MDDRVDDQGGGGELAAALGAHLERLAFADRGTDEVTELIIDAVAGWGLARQWRVYRRAPSVVPLPPPYERQFSVVDVGIARPGERPAVVEVDHGDRRRTVDKLVAEAAAGRTAILVRWGTGRGTPPPPPIHLVTLRVTSRTGGAARGRLHSRTPDPDRPAPAHTTPGDGYTPEPMPMSPATDPVAGR